MNNKGDDAVKYWYAGIDTAVSGIAEEYVVIPADPAVKAKIIKSKYIL